MKILIVEDNKDLQSIYEGLFMAAGHDVKVSGNGLIGITDAVDYQPDTVLLDIMMPEMNGNEFLKALRNNTSISPVVIVCSNLSQQFDIDTALVNGAHFYLRKSDFTGDVLVKEVERLYQQHQTGAQQSQPA
jgi:DNA-binding response OmpR family regulator